MAKRKRLTKKQRKRRKKWLIILFIGILFFISGYISGHQDLDFGQVQTKLNNAKTKIEKQLKDFELVEKKEKMRPSKTTEGVSEIHVFDIGQGSSILLVAKDGSNILIDTGDYDDTEKKVITYLDEEIGLGGEIDLLIFSANDSKHIGHADLVLEYFDVQEVWMSGEDRTTKAYSNLLDGLLESNAEYKEPKAGENIIRNLFDIQVLHPEEGSAGEDQTEGSLLTHIEFDGISLMGSGNISIPQENEIVERTGSLKSDILLLSDHGADNNSDQWIAAIDPEIAFYQGDTESSEGNPRNEIIQRLEDSGVAVYGTEELGTISLYFDENKEIDIETSLGLEEDSEG